MMSLILLFITGAVLIATLTWLVFDEINAWWLNHGGLNLPIRYDSKHASFVKSIIDDMQDHPEDWDDISVNRDNFIMHNFKRNIQLKIISRIRILHTRSNVKINDLPLRTCYRLAYEMHRWRKKRDAARIKTMIQNTMEV